MAFVRVRDKQTRHEFDVPEDHFYIRDGLVEVLKRKGPSRYPRPARHFRRLPSSEPQSEPSPSGGGSSISKETEEAL